MAAGTRVLCFLIICSLVCSSRAQKIITPDLGEDVILPCKTPDNINVNKITAVEWSRPDQDPEYVLFYRDGRFDPHSQHPSYKNQVDLQNKEMKDGDFSLILKNVTMEDNGTYECHVFEEGNNKPINITLEVHPSGKKGGNTGDGGNKTGVIVGLVVAVILLAVLASLCFLMYKRSMRQNTNLPVPPDEAAAEQML